MSPKIDYEADNCEKEHEKISNVAYNVTNNETNYQNETGHKGKEKRCFTRYVTGDDSKEKHHHHHHHHHHHQGSTDNKGSEHVITRQAKSSKTSRGSSSKSSKHSKPSRTDLAYKCYDLKVGKKNACSKARKWQTGKYKRDECGSGIIPKRLDFKPTRNIWCKTPLSLYQATVGELGRKLLCGEKVVPKDIKPEPPCNIDQYIMPMCRGYYRKYECLRPCEEEHIVVRGGKKTFRDTVERYWDPCMSKWQKFRLDVNDYAPQNAALAQKLRRNERTTDIPCW